MSKTITLTQAVIDRITIDPDAQTIGVIYHLRDDTGVFIDRLKMTYCRSIPLDPEGNPVDNSDRRFVVMTTTQFNYVLTLYTAIKAEVDSRLV